MNAPELLPVRPESPVLSNVEGVASTSSARTASGSNKPHESARAQVAGAATYVDDIPEIKGTLHAAPILSNVAHGKLLGVDTSAALAMPGVRDVIVAKDIPGHPMLASFMGDEPIFATDTVQHIGQVIHPS